MGQLVAMRFPGQNDARDAMFRLRRCCPDAMGIRTALAISTHEAQKATVEQLVDPLDLEDPQWSSFWVGLLYAAQAEFLAEKLSPEVMHQVPVLFFDPAWWSEEINLGSGFLNDIHVLLSLKGASVLMALYSGDEFPRKCLGSLLPETTVCREVPAEKMRLFQKIIRRKTSITDLSSEEGMESEN